MTIPRPRGNWLPYAFLLPLATVALLYQLFYSWEVFESRQPGRSVDVPVVTYDLKIVSVDGKAAKAGARVGDTLVSLDGIKPVGARDLFRAYHRIGSRSPLILEVTRKETGKRETIAIPPPKPEPPAPLGAILISGTFAMVMLLCVVAGIYPVAMHPRDVRAWVFFGMMLATSQVITSAQWFDFPRPLQYLAFLAHNEPSISSGIWLTVFPLYFPERFAWDIKRPWLKWIALGPILVIHAVVAVLVADSFFSFHRMDQYLGWIPIHSTLPFAAFGFVFFFASLFVRLFTTRSRDAKRRLRILVAGCVISLGPLCGLIAYQIVALKNKAAQPGDEILIPVCFLFCLFPVTLAYLIVVQRAMDLHMVVRQGLRYTIAKAGMHVLSAIVLSSLLWPLSGLMFGSTYTHMDPQTETGLKVSIFAFFVSGSTYLLRRLRAPLGQWVDKLFFREAYNADLILEELSESVGSMIVEEEMLSTVAHRISESLHVPQLAFLLQADGAFHPVYCLGLDLPVGTSLPIEAQTVAAVKSAKVPPPIYLDSKDNWVYSAPEPEISTLQSLRTQLLLPVRSRKELLGIISLGPKRSEAPYSGTDIQLLRSVATQTGLALENSRLTKAMANEVAKRERLNREIEIAREVQERLFPQRLPAIEGIDYFGACRPALGVGGDYYDFLSLPGEGLGIAIGDVSGKGIAAALLMASLQASLRGQALVGQADLAQLISNVNQLVYEASPINRYATFFYCQFHLSTGLFRYVNAGHNPPFILRRSNGTSHLIHLDVGGPPVGLLPGVPYQEASLYLQPGDIFVAFTDGISEAMNPEEEEWGESRLIPAVTSYAQYCAAELIPKLMADADAFASGAPQHDDMTLVIMKLTGLQN